MPVADEIERVIPSIQLNCAASGGCAVYRDEHNLTLVFGEAELCWITQEGSDANIIREKIRAALNK